MLRKIPCLLLCVRHALNIGVQTLLSIHLPIVLGQDSRPFSASGVMQDGLTSPLSVPQQTILS